jgi:hypothetical protein
MAGNTLKKGSWRELNTDIQMFSSENSPFRMEIGIEKSSGAYTPIA